MSKFASKTTVDTDRSLAEIKKLLTSHGATKFAYFEAENQAAIAFEIRERRFRFTIPLPNPNAREFTHTPETKVERAPAKAKEAWQQAVKQRYRALLNVIKFKLVAINEGVTTFEDEFLAHTLLPDGSTVGDWAAEQIKQVYLSGKMPPLLGGH